jgi:apolipoprotein D and lipocalin family protein
MVFCKNLFSVLFLIVMFLQVSCSHSKKSDLDTVSYVDMTKYQGTWFEIARYGNTFQKNCQATRANYTLNENGTVSVLNECKNKEGDVESAEGTAFVEDSQSNAKLSVSFVPFFQRFGLFAGDYWIIELDEMYQYAVVGHPERTYLWILSRTPVLEEGVLSEIKQKLVNKHFYSLERLESTPSWDK